MAIFSYYQSGLFFWEISIASSRELIVDLRSFGERNYE